MTRFPAHAISETGASNHLQMLRRNGKAARQQLEALEEILDYILRTQGEETAPLFLENLVDKLRRAGLKVPGPVSTPVEREAAPVVPLVPLRPPAIVFPRTGTGPAPTQLPNTGSSEDHFAGVLGFATAALAISGLAVAWRYRRAARPETE